MKNNKDNFWVVTLFITSFIITSFSIHWAYHGLLNDEKKEILTLFPYLKISFILTFITFLFGRICYLEDLYQIPDDKKIIGKSLIPYYFIILILTLILYPSIETLKISSDSMAFTVVFVVAISQTLSLYYLTLVNENTNSKNFKNISILILTALLLIFTSKYVSNFFPKSTVRNSEYQENY